MNISIIKMDESDVIVSSVEIIKDKLYFATLQYGCKPKSTRNSKYFNIEEELVYESFFLDYGPYHLCHLYFFCEKLNNKLLKVQKNKKVVFYTSDDKIDRLNAAYLIGCYSIIYLNKTPRAAYELIIEGSWELLTYRDASGGCPLFEISLLDVLEGLYKAFIGGFFDFEHFNYQEYMFYERVLNGDLNWIIPEKMLAFSGPHAQSRRDDYPLHAPSHYHKYFKDNNVSTVVRLNQKSYNAKQFTEYGFEHYELFFLDGSVPSDVIVDKFNKICEKAKGAVAVHCKAGLGRTGTLIACYLMKHHEFTARQAISWLRICRPGSVIGFQQNFLIDVQVRMLSEGAHYRRRNGISSLPKFKHGIYSNMSSMNDEDSDNGNFGDSSINDTSADDLENMPTHKPTAYKASKNTDLQSATPQNKDEYVSLNSIINNNKDDTVATRSMTQRTRINSGLANAKNVYTTSKNNYIMSNSSSNNIKPVTVKVQTTYTPKKMQSVSNVKPASYSMKGSATHIKVSLTKSQYVKANRDTQRANLARSHAPTCSFSHSAGSVKTYARKTPNIKLQDNVKKSTAATESTSNNNKEFDANSNLSDGRNNHSTGSRSTNDLSRKKIILRKKSLKVNDSSDQIKDFKNCNISNSDSERDSTGTAFTNISADSLENIPCKMATRRNKSKSPVSMQPLGEVSNRPLDNMEETSDPQGSKLCQIKANRKKFSNFGSNLIKKEGVKTRNYTNMSVVKKK